MPVSSPRASLSATAWFLALLGAVPFAVLGLALALAPDFAAETLGGVDAFLSYGAVILSFMGGVRWGAAMGSADAGAARVMMVSVVPALLGWLALLLAPVPAMFLLAAGFVLQGVWDVRSAAAGDLPLWFGRLRTAISAVVVVSILIALSGDLVSR